MILRPVVAVAAAAFVVAGCADRPSATTQPVGLVPSAGAVPPQAASPSGLLGEAEVGADSLSDPAIETLGDPML